MSLVEGGTFRFKRCSTTFAPLLCLADSTALSAISAGPRSTTYRNIFGYISLGAFLAMLAGGGGATRRVRPRREEEQPSQASGPSAREGDNDTTTTTHAEGKTTDATAALADDLKEQKATIASWASLIQATEVTTEDKDQEAIAVMLADLEAQKDTIDTWLALAQALTEEPTENKTKEIKAYLAKAMHDAKKLLDQMKGKQ